MLFSSPWLLVFGLLGIISPFLIHLMMRQRRVKKVFSSLRLIEECHRVSKRRKRIKNWSLFLLRVLLIILLALLFGKPLLSGTLESGQKKATVFIVDASASMKIKGADGGIWTQVMDQLRTHLDSMHRESEVCVIRTDVSSEEDAPWVTPVQAEKSISQWEGNSGSDSSPLVGSLLKAVSKVDSLKGDYPAEIHIIGDLQISSLDQIEKLKLPDGVIVKVTQINSPWGNEYGIVASAAGTDMLRTGVYNIRAQDRAEVIISGEEKPIEVNGDETISLPYLAENSGWHERTIKLNKSDDFALDNLVYDAYNTQPNIDILVVEPEMYKKVFERRSFFASRALAPLTADVAEESVKSLTRFRVKTLSLQDLELIIDDVTVNVVIILSDLQNISPAMGLKLNNFINNGGGVVLFGGPDVEVQGWNTSLAGIRPVTLSGSEEISSSKSLSRISREHPIWGGLSVNNRDKIRRSSFTNKHTLSINESSEVLAGYADGTPLIVRGKVGKGACVFVNTTIDRRWSDWPQTPEFFVPTIHTIVSKALPESSIKGRNTNNLFHASYQRIDIPLEGVKPGMKVLLNDQEYEIAENSTIRDAVLADPGFYSIKDTDGRTLKTLAVNTIPSEGIAEFFTEQDFKALLESRRISATRGDKQTIHRADVHGSGIPWKITLLVLLTFLIVEPLFANRS